MMTELEQAKYLALSQIKDRWADPLQFEERQELYKYLVKEEYLPFAAAHECCGGCVD